MRRSRLPFAPDRTQATHRRDVSASTSLAKDVHVFGIRRVVTETLFGEQTQQTASSTVTPLESSERNFPALNEDELARISVGKGSRLLKPFKSLFGE